jgi:hypothetical protein
MLLHRRHERHRQQVLIRLLAVRFRRGFEFRKFLRDLAHRGQQTAVNLGLRQRAFHGGTTGRRK